MEAVERIREMEKILQGAKPVLQRLNAALVQILNEAKYQTDAVYDGNDGLDGRATSSAKA